MLFKFLQYQDLKEITRGQSKYQKRFVSAVGKKKQTLIPNGI